MRAPILVRPEALRDIEETRDWLAGHSESAAMRFLDAFESAANRIACGPAVYAVAFREQEGNFIVRNFLFHINRRRPFSIYYTLHNDEVQILRVRGAGQATLTWQDFDVDP